MDMKDAAQDESGGAGLGSNVYVLYIVAKNAG